MSELNIFIINKPPEEEESLLEKMLKEKREMEKLEILREIQRTNKAGSFHAGGG